VQTASASKQNSRRFIAWSGHRRHERPVEALRKQSVALLHTRRCVGRDQRHEHFEPWKNSQNCYVQSWSGDELSSAPIPHFIKWTRNETCQPVRVLFMDEGNAIWSEPHRFTSKLEARPLPQSKWPITFDAPAGSVQTASTSNQNAFTSSLG
jgi:hypothetical protein